jgi:signal transduction histidine kinase
MIFADSTPIAAKIVRFGYKFLMKEEANVVKLKEFNLALGVINNILVLDKNNRILFAGDEIRRLLFNSKKNFEEALLDNFPDSAARQELEEKIDLVRKNQNTQYLQLGNHHTQKRLFLFPANYAQSDNIILATEKQVLRANHIETELKERVKELECLYKISNELETNQNLEDALTHCASHLAGGIQYPQSVATSFQLDGHLYGDPGCVPGSPGNRLSEDIVINGEVRGKISICYRHQTEFLEEEKKLLREISLMTSRIIERKEGRKNLENQRELLVSKNQELTQLTGDLTRSNNNLQAFLNAITDTIVVIDTDFNITLSNKEEVGTSGKCYKKVFKSDNVCPDCPAMLAFRKARPASVERRLDSQYYTLQAYPILDEKKGTVETVLEICSDITAEEHMKRHLIQSYKLASLGKLVAGVAHEINNPNTFIRGNIKIISEAFGDILPLLDRVYDENQELKIARLSYQIFRENIPVLLEDMMGGANRIKKIVDGLRNFAKKDEGLLTDEVDINHMIQNNLRITSKEVRKYARLELNLASSIPTFKGNIQKLEQVLMNMLINASQAIEKEDGLILMKTELGKETNEVIISISDNGKGMDDSTRKHIFDPFFTTKRDKGGTGLGLSISYGIIQEHKGRIDVDSQVGHGTTFRIRIPIVPPDSKN